MWKHNVMWIILLGAFVGCARDKQTTRATAAINDPAVMKATVLRNIAKGTALANAIGFMEREGFECSIRRNESSSGQSAVREGIDYIYCDRHDPIDYWVGQRWQIVVVLKEDAVADVLVSHGYIGP